MCKNSLQSGTGSSNQHCSQSSPYGPLGFQRDLICLEMFIIVGIEVETTIPADILIFPVIWSCKLAEEGRRMLVSAHVSPLHLDSYFPGP